MSFVKCIVYSLFKFVVVQYKDKNQVNALTHLMNFEGNNLHDYNFFLLLVVGDSQLFFNFFPVNPTTLRSPILTQLYVIKGFKVCQTL